jgi:putative ABC transport system ATP-binding protein
MSPLLALQISRLRFRWPGQGHEVLQLAHMALPRSGRLLVYGDSGCGKSTLLSLAAGVVLPSAGEVSLLGQAWHELSVRERERRRADHVGYVFQQFNLLPYLSVIDNVMLPCQLSLRRASRCAQPRQAAQHLLAALDLDPSLWSRPAAQLSVGQQQRVAAARALIGQPELVIADEPTSALDERRRDAFMQLLIEQCQQAGSALLFVTHDERLQAYFEHTLHLPSATESQT